MTTATYPKIPGLIPDPREIRPLGGTTELGRDVHLITRDIPPLQRETMQEILTAAGVRVAEHATKCIVEVRMETIADLEVSGVPESAYDEYYELEVRDNRALIRAAGREGALWGTHTLAGLFRAAATGVRILNLKIRDWPDLTHRGIFVENKWGPDRMALSDWVVLIDRMAALKMNRLGIGLYGCWGSCRYEGQPTEFLMVPVPGHPELKTEKRLRWYAPGDAAWHSETYLPTSFEEDFLGEVVAYGRRKGVVVIPFVNSLGHNTMIPRLVPEISAKAGDGTPLGIGYCLSNPKTRAFIEAFYGSIVERYYPEGADFFHVQLDEVWPDHPDPNDPGRRANPWCQCPACRARDREEALQAYILWLVAMLTQKGVKKVVMWNDQLTRHMDALNESFVQKLNDAGLADRLILHWWWYSNEALNEKTRVSIGKQLGLAGWVAPMTCYFNWERYSPTLRNIELMLKMAHEEGAEGAVSYAVHDPGWADHEMLLASYAWNFGAVGSSAAQREKWARGRFGSEASRFLAATELLQRAASYPVLAHCYYYRYTYCREGVPFPRAYPGEALATLAGMEAEEVLRQLRETGASAHEAAIGFEALARGTDRDADDLACVRSLLGEAARIEGLAATFAYLFSVRQVASGEGIDEDLVSSCGAARTSLLKAMAVMEENKPDWVVPASLQALSALLEFLDQLRGDLAEVKEGSRKPEAIRWHLG